MMPNKSIYRDADAAEINLYELNFARFFSIQTSENGWRRVVCELVRRAAKGTKELRLEDGTELPGEKTFRDYVVDLMDSYLAVLPDAKPHAYPAAEREQLMERHCRHTEDGGIDYDYYQDMTLDTFIFNMRNVGAGALYAKRGPFWHGGHMEQCHFEELFRLIEEEGEEVFGETQERYADLAANDITAEAEHRRSHQTGQGHNFLFHHDFLLCFCFAYTHSIASPHQKVKASPKNHREILCHDDIISPLSFLFNTLYRTSCFPAPAKTYTAVRPQWSRHPR